MLTLICLLVPACGDNAPGENQNNNTNETRSLCGNGIVEGTEECDHGHLNSDLAPDACRGDCLNPRCPTELIVFSA